MTDSLSAPRVQPAQVQRLRDFTDRIVPPLPGRPPTLADIERRRAQLWLIAMVVLGALSLAVSVHALRIGALGFALAFALYVGDQERRLRRATAQLVDERALTTALRARIADLATLTKVGRVVNSVLSLEEVLESLLHAAFELTGSTTGSVMLLEHGRLVVVASAGQGAAPTEAHMDVGAGVAGWVAAQREPIAVTGRLAPGQFGGSPDRSRDQGSSICAPLIVGGDLLGVLAVERAVATPVAFTEPELRAVAIFAEHAASAVSNALRYEDERRSVDRLAIALERRSEFVATLVHDLKTPLSVVLGFLGILEDRWDTLDEGRRADVLNAMRNQATRLREMVDEVLRTSSADAGRELQREPVELTGLLTELASSFATIALERQGVERPIDLDLPTTPVTVWGDPEALRHVFENLIENAVKYSPSGSPIVLRVLNDEGVVSVDVSDAGDGIAPDELPHVFERFRQGSSARAGGVGLGLYIVRTLVNAHAGRVTVRSTPGHGTTFTVSLPVRALVRDDLEILRSATVR